jgi:hypothetical protein
MLKKSKLHLLIGVLLAIIFIFIFVFCFAGNHKKKGIHLEVVKVEANLVEHIEKGYGYQIYVNDTLVIYQPFIPDVQGKIPFRSKEDAFKVGDFVVNRMRTHNDFFVSQRDLEKLGVIDNKIIKH